MGQHIKCVIQIKIYRNVHINRYSAELIFPEYPAEKKVQRSCAAANVKELCHWLNNIANGMEIHLEDAEGGDSNVAAR